MPLAIIDIDLVPLRVEFELAIRGLNFERAAMALEVVQQHFRVVVKGERVSEPVWNGLRELIGVDPREAMSPEARQVMRRMRKRSRPKKTLDTAAGL